MSIKALERSIQKWNKIAWSDGKDKGTENCTLCKKYYNHGVCIGCPVYEFTDRVQCAGTPYEMWLKHQEERHDDVGYEHPKVECETCRTIAIAETKFLEALLARAKEVKKYGKR